MATFFEEYNNLPTEMKAGFRAQIMEWCEIQPSTFQKWIGRKHVPKLPQKVIAHYMERPQDELFPDN